jgi:tetratricopeptide (TPR) repeat protein
MTRTTIVCLTLIGLLTATPVRAGVYLPTEEPILVPVDDGQGRPMPSQQFQNIVFPLVRSLGLPLPGKPEGSDETKQYREKRDALLKKGRANLSADEIIALSGYQIRLRELAEAELTLAPARQKYRDRFEIYANLAVIQFQTGRFDEALQYQSQTLDLLRTARLPANLPRDWLIKAERKFRELIRLRRTETVGGDRTAMQIDRLFPDDAFAQPQARSEAIALVQQLLFWLPDDARLYWQLGRLYQAAEYWPEAGKIYDDLTFLRGFSPPALKDHRREVLAKVAELPQETPIEIPPTIPDADPPPERWRPSHGRLLLVGAAAGLLLLALAWFQWRELRRRWRSGAPKATD